MTPVDPLIKPPLNPVALEAEAAAAVAAALLEAAAAAAAGTPEFCLTNGTLG